MPTFEEFHLGKAKPTSDEPLHIDAKGSQCPGPIISLSQALKEATMEQEIIIEVTDPGFKTDATAWAEVTGNPMTDFQENEGIFTAHFTKKRELGDAEIPPKEDCLTLVMFSDELDKGMAAFNIALGALAMGMQVHIFFTFWGLSLIRKRTDAASPKDTMGKMMSKILPTDDKSLPLSHDNFMGFGAKMMNRMMKEKNVPPLDFMVHLARYDGVKFIACQMSMEILEISADELLDGIEIGGVATMLAYARRSNLNYFI